MQRYFLNQKIDHQFELPAGSDTFQHFGKVLRAREGSKAEFVDADQRLYLAEVTAVTPDAIALKVLEERKADVELPFSVRIVVSPIKNDRNDWLVQKATELGVDEIVFTKMARTVVDWRKQQEKKLTRFQKIAQAAAEQSHRLKVPKVRWADDFKECIGPDDAIRLVAWEESAKEGEQSTLVKTIAATQPGQTIVLWFGPEGGLTTEEIDRLQSVGFLPLGLGPRILRAETAPLYALSAISTLSELG
ncbi:RsmE family RNA methyltransferase [Eupransor demetentiae]|uniref:Ribosomal RNA small subunit methyltransferase E n=1 Tax=Eupransor demetentiae TaxID=3109584 RepID=A0ABM9N3R7_9LACO|nr:16S rRNA U1498 N3-methylase RsmE (RsmE) [Lactobacillaceae bacterium LMG 33000]